MSHFSDSRDPNGIGYLILQDHGFEGKKIPDHGRGSLVGVRVLGRKGIASLRMGPPRRTW